MRLPLPLRDEVARGVADAAINRYPDAGALHLKQKNSRCHRVATGDGNIARQWLG
ncbi:MAG: hypothetical protein WDM70_11165 [Nitrosomonadales bacterium]